MLKDKNKSNQINLHSKLNWTNENFPAMADYTISNVLDIEGFDDFSYIKKYYHDEVDDDVFFLEKISPHINLISRKNAIFLNKLNKSKFISYYNHVKMRTSLARFHPEFYLSKDSENRLIFYLIRKKCKNSLTRSHYYKYSVIVRCELKNSLAFSEMIKTNYQTSVKPFFYITLFVGSNQINNFRNYQDIIEINSERELVKYCIAINSNIYNLLEIGSYEPPPKIKVTSIKESRFNDIRIHVKKRKMKKLKTKKTAQK